MSRDPGKPRISDDPDATIDARVAAPSSHDADDPRLLSAVQEYLSELETGRRPSRKEFLQRYADIAPQLSQCLDGLAFVHSTAGKLEAAAQAAQAADAPETDLVTAEPLGDFKLIRQIGRGGMGTVYEALQLSLGRRVALKILPFAASLDPRHLQRFRNEAQAAAQLHHTNIVPVYAVGCERSVHYYAMQLIEGQSLADVIRNLRSARDARHPDSRTAAPSDPTMQWPSPGSAQPATSQPAFSGTLQLKSSLSGSSTLSDAPAHSLSLLRSSRRASFYQTVARLGLQAAEALDYAHQHGVVHRDIKPENLLLDTRNNLWITDFGLAQFYAEGTITRTGDLLGTLRYMSPEQASGTAVVLDQRTDIYSLGLTLYELLTLERALPGETREQLLRQIGSHEPRSPRSIDRALPPELETILTKATAKDAADRYPTARALADDLRRFLNDEPILARPPSLWDKSVKWTRRHRSLTISALTILILSAVGLLISTVLIASEQDKTKAAYERERDRAAEASLQRIRAERSYRQAREAVDFFARIAAEEMDRPEFGDLRKPMLEASLAYYESFLKDRENEPGQHDDLDAASARVATILSELTAFDRFFRTQYRIRLLSEQSVRTELKLSADQIANLEKYADAGARDRQPGGFDPRRMSLEERRERFSTLADNLESHVNQVLSVQQAQRLREIYRQVRGHQAFNDPEVLDALALTQEQRSRIRTIQAEGRDFFRRGSRSDQADRDPRELLNRILATLTPAQLQVWNSLIGTPFTGTISGRDRGPRPGP